VIRYFSANIGVGQGINIRRVVRQAITGISKEM